jgi:SIT family siderophore-iron:H+ symporter-like MFS transporter
MLGTGLMIRYRTSTNSNAELYLVQIIRGMASAFIPYPCQSLIQSAAPHEQLAAITAGWLVVYYIAVGEGWCRQLVGDR